MRSCAITCHVTKNALPARSAAPAPERRRLHVGRRLLKRFTTQRLPATADSGDASLASGTQQGAAEHRILLISPLWPEPSSSAAGVRTQGFIDAFLSWGWPVSYLSPAKRNNFSTHLDSLGVSTFSIKPNRRKELEAILEETQPTICIFDRFFSEEAFSFVIRDACPDALRVLDTQDLHFLRNGRQACLKGSKDKSRCLPEVMRHIPNSKDDAFLRELAAIHRSDLSIMCSRVEMSLLSEHYGIHQSKIALSSFLCDPPKTQGLPAFADRNHFMTIGNFKHPPNLDSVKWLADELWDPIRKSLISAGEEDPQLHIYGAYPSNDALRLHDPKRGLHILGHASSLDIMRDYRVCLTPLRFGAGLKGKVLDAWAHGLPVCTTPIGAEGLFSGGFPAAGSLDSWLSGSLERAAREDAAQGGNAGGHSPEWRWGGSWAATSPEAIAQDAVKLYTQQEFWEQSQTQGHRLLEELFSATENAQDLKRVLVDSFTRSKAQRQTDFVGSMLWHQNNRATEFFSRWIELKETIATASEAE